MSEDYLSDIKKLKNDSKFGAETLRTTVKEEYLGREKGAKRGETDVAYGGSSMFQIIIGLRNQDGSNVLKTWSPGRTRHYLEN